MSGLRPSAGRALAWLLAVLLAAALPAVLGVATAGPADASTCVRATDGRVTVVVVLDTGSGTPQVRCVTVPLRATGADALFAAVGADPRTGVRTGEGFDGKGAGFVCGILGVPATGCVDDAAEPSWSYWHAAPGGSWTKSTVGFLSYRIADRHGAADGCTVEGWRYGVVDPADPASGRPSIPPGGLRCDAPALAAAPTAPAGPNQAAPASPASRVGAAPPSGATADAGAPAASVAGAAASGTGAPDPAGGPATDVPASTTASTTPGDTATPASGAAATDDDPEPSDGPDDADVSGELAAATVPDDGSGPGSGALVAVALVAGLGALAVVRLRARRTTPS